MTRQMDAPVAAPMDAITGTSPVAQAGGGNGTPAPGAFTDDCGRRGGTRAHTLSVERTFRAPGLTRGGGEQGSEHFAWLAVRLRPAGSPTQAAPQ